MGEASGPYTGAQVRKLAEHGKLLPDSHVRKGTDGKWTRADRVQGLRFPTQTSSQIPGKAAGKQRVLMFTLLGFGLMAAIACVLAFLNSSNRSTGSTSSKSDTSKSYMAPPTTRQNDKREAPKPQPFDFVTNREKMIGFAFARLQHARYLNNQGSPVSFDEMRLYTLGIHHLKRRTPNGNEIQSRLSLDSDGQNFIYLESKSSATTMDLALDAALEFESVYTWVDATAAAQEAFEKLETAREDEDSTGFNQSRSTTHQAQVGTGISTWYIQINEQLKPDSHGQPWAKVLMQWDWRPVE